MRSIAIKPFIEQHIDEAASRWQQRDQSPVFPQLKFSDFCHIDQLLHAHIDALVSADDTGWEMAWDALLRWRRPGEVFVCAVLAMQHGGNEKRLNQILTQVNQQAEYRLRSLISAFLWCDIEQSAPLIGVWTAGDASIIQQVAAWRSVARSRTLSAVLATRPDCTSRLVDAMQHADPCLRAAACRAAGVFGYTNTLIKCLADDHPAVVAEAAIALGTTNPQRSIAPLWQSVWQCVQSLPTSGRSSALAERRLRRWLQHLALLVPTGATEVPQLLDSLPPRLGLHFVLHHADPSQLSWVVRLMEDASCARLAGWIWQAMTGIDLKEHKLTLREYTDTLGGDTDNLDSGLYWPDAHKISRYPLALPHASILQGKPLDRIQLQVLLSNAPQPLRWNAAQRLAVIAGRPIINTQDRACTQRMVLDKLTTKTAETVT